MGDLHRFRIGQMQGLLNPFRFIIFQVKNDLCLAVVDVDDEVDRLEVEVQQCTELTNTNRSRA